MRVSIRFRRHVGLPSFEDETAFFDRLNVPLNRMNYASPESAERYFGFRSCSR